MDKFDEEMEKLAKSYKDRADKTLDVTKRKAEESALGTALRNFGTFALFNLIVAGA